MTTKDIHTRRAAGNCGSFVLRRFHKNPVDKSSSSWYTCKIRQLIWNLQILADPGWTANQNDRGVIQ